MNLNHIRIRSLKNSRNVRLQISRDLRLFVSRDLQLIFEITTNLENLITHILR